MAGNTKNQKSNLQEQKYRKSKFEKFYSDADKFVIYNDNDKHISPVVLRLPEPPQLNLIDGYGLTPLDQKFKRLEVPEKLNQLELLAKEELSVELASRQKNVTPYKTQKRFWNLLSRSRKFYRNEIIYIKKIHYYLEYGYWCYIKGKPYWLPPKYFHFINFWRAIETNEGYFDYRDTDRRNYIFRYYCETTTETFSKIDEEGNAIPEEDGTYKMIDLGRRTCLGDAKPKRRREGASHQRCADGVYDLCRNKMANVALIADTGDSAEDIWRENFMPGWDNYPLFLRPVNNAGSEPTEIRLRRPIGVYEGKYLGGRIGYIKTAGERATDRRKMKNIIYDESGKVDRSDVFASLERSIPTLKQGNIIHGYVTLPSTIEEMKDGGSIFEEICDNSNFYQRTPAGLTKSGVFRVFNKSWDGRDGFIDPWGFSVIDSPTEDQLEYAPPNSEYAIRNIGAKEDILTQLEALKNSKDPRDQKLYRLRIRKEPTCWADCWIGSAGDMGFPLIKIDNRMADLKRKSETIQGNYEWKNEKFGDVIFIEDKAHGRWDVSNLFLTTERNAWVMEDPVYNVELGRDVISRRPYNPVTVAGADPFAWGNKTQAQLTATRMRMSDGGGADFWLYDSLLDKDKDLTEATSYSFIASYRVRTPSQKDYFDDMLKMCIYNNSMMLVEKNIGGREMIKYYLDNGFYGYLLRLRKSDGTLETTPGIYTQSQQKTDYFNALRDYLEIKAHREKHLFFLDECKSIKGPEEMFKYDRLTAHAIALVGAQNMGYVKEIEKINEASDLDISDTDFAEITYF